MTDYDEFYDDDDELTAEDLVEMLKGNYGPEAQAAAFELTGYQPVNEPDEINPEYANEFTAQAIRKERDLGRPLTQKEIQELAVDQAGSGPPDLDEAYERINNRSLNDDDDRKAIMSEYLEETNAAQDAQAAAQAADGAD